MSRSKSLLKIVAASVVAIGSLSKAEAGSPNMRFIGVFDSNGRPAIVEVRNKIKNVKLTVPSGHLPNPELTIPTFTRVRFTTLASTVEGILPKADERFNATIQHLKSDGRLIRFAKAVAPLYGVDPAAILGALIGELTFNNEMTSAMQDAAALVPSQGYFTGANRLSEKLKEGAFDFCGIKHRDYWAWVCVNRIWNMSIMRARDPVNMRYPSIFLINLDANEQPLHGVLRPGVIGATYGPAQMSLMRALMLSEDVHLASGGRIPRLWIDDMPAVLKSITQLEPSIHFVAATLMRSVDAYKRFAKIDISQNLGLQATLFNLGWEFELALKARSQNIFSAKPAIPRENYFGWFINRHEAEIRELVR